MQSVVKFWIKREVAKEKFWNLETRCHESLVAIYGVFYPLADFFDCQAPAISEDETAEVLVVSPISVEVLELDVHFSRLSPTEQRLAMEL